MKRLEKTTLIEGRTIRFTNFIDDESFRFEADSKDLMKNAAIEQTLTYLRHLKRPFYLFQMRQASGIPAMQVCIFVGQPKWLKNFALASIPNMHRAINEVEEEFGLKILKQYCSEIPSLMTLRLQPQRYQAHDLASFEKIALKQEYKRFPPLGATRTLLLDLGPSAEMLMAELASKTRSKLKHKGRDLVELRSITDPRFIEKCRQANNESRARSGSNETPYDFETAFAIAKNHPDQGRVIGLFFKGEPDQLVAYVIGLRNGTRCEYSSAGSLGDARLRAMPFNYFLFWELSNWARDVGCTQIDMGGITDGGELDPLRGISRFKRSLTDVEVEVGREMVSVLRPIRYSIYCWLKRFQRVYG